MTKTKTTTSILIVTAALWLAGPSPAGAQTASGPKTYINVSVGAQPLRRTVDATATAKIFDEDATFSAKHRIANGPFVDISAGRRITWTNLIVGGGFSSFSSKGNAAGTASIPDPIFVGKPKVVPIAAGDLQRTERSFHAQAVWFRQVNKKVDLAVALGPSIIRVSQQFISGSVATGSQTVTIGAETQSGTGVGVNIGADSSYMLTPRYGVGVLVRYTWAKVGLSAADVTAGGLQAGLGLRARF